MPGTRNKTASPANNNADAEKPGASQAKRYRQTDTYSEETPGAATSQTPQRGRRGQVAMSTDDSATTQSGAIPQGQLAVSPSASPRKRGRPRKDEVREKSAVVDTSAEDNGPMKVDVGEKSAAAVETKKNEEQSRLEDGGKESSEAKLEGQTSGDTFSPRRSGRGVVFNRRFQDMELDFGRKRPKEERSDEPKEKRARKQGKKEVVIKGQKTPARGPGKAKSVTPITKDQLDVVSQPLSAATSIPSKQPRPTSLSSPTPSSTQIVISSPGKMPPSGLKGNIPQTPEKKAQPPILSRSWQSKSPSSVVMISASPTSITQTATTAGRTIAITSSTAMLAHSAVSREDSAVSSGVTKKNSEGGATTPLKESSTEISTDETGFPVQADDAAVENVSPSVVDVVVVPGQPRTKGPRVVNISPVTHNPAIDTGSQSSAETPGRVVGKPTTEGSSASKSVFIVRNPAHSSSATARTESGSSGSISATGEGAGDVMSMVELSPNKKVPVVLAKRKENTPAVSKVVKVVSAHQVLQLPTDPKKAVTTKVVQQKASGLLESRSVGSGQQKTVQVSVSSVASSAPQILVSKESAPATEQTTQPHEIENIQLIALETDDQQNVPLVKAEVQTGTIQDDNVAVTASSVSTSSSTPSSVPAQVSTTSATDTNANMSVTVTTTTTTDAELHNGDSDGSQNQTRIESVSKSLSCGSFTEEDEDDEEGDEDDDDNDDDDDDDDDESEDGILLDDKYTTSGTQTPYAKSNARRVITVHVHPPSKAGEQNREVVTVTKVERGDDSNDGEERREYVHHDYGAETKGKYIVVDLPEGTTVKQPHVRSSERFDSDPSFYTMDEQGMFVCHICDYKTLRRPNFYKHKKKHLGVRQYACDQCQYRAATSSNLKRHMEIHKDIRNHKCTMCDLFFRQKIHLERHIKYRHEEKRVKCPFCDYICANENPDLKVHIKRRHIAPSSSEAAMKCPDCGIVATSKRDLRQHLKFHSKGPELKLFCKICSFVTDCESRLRRHQYIHTKEKPFQCGLCEYRGSQKEHVLRHMRTQHNIEIARNRRSRKLEGERGGDGEGGKGVERADYTSEEKIFACNHCTMKFAKLINLYKHLHTQHRDIMPSEQTDFSCVVCDFHTTNKKNLLVHMRRHNVTDQSPPSHVYSCVLCRYMNPKRRNLFQHMRKKHHIEIVTRDDGSTTCYVAHDPVSGVPVSGADGVPISSQNPSHNTDPMITVLPLSDLISTVAQPTDLHTSRNTITISSGTISTPLKMEDIAVVVSNPQTITAASMEGEGGLVDSGAVETITIGALSQDDAAEAIQGLQALAQRGVLENGTIMEEQVQVMGSDDQTTLVIDPSSFGVVEQLVQPKTEPLEVVEIDSSQLLDQVTSISVTSQQEAGLLGDSGTSATAAPEGFQLSAEQLMNLSTGDLLEINGEMFKVEVSSETNPDGTPGQQIISFEPANISVDAAAAGTMLEEEEVSSETAELT